MVLLVWLLTACSKITDVRREVVSPDGKLVARYYEVNAGGVAGSIREFAAVSASDAEFSADAADPFFEMSRGGDADLRWLDNQRLRVEYGAWARVYRRCGTADSVRIEYEILTEAPASWSEVAKTGSEMYRTGVLDTVSARRRPGLVQGAECP